MTFPGHNSHLFRWRSKTSTDKTQAKEDGDIDQWRKRVEMASEFAVSEVFSLKKPQSGSSSRAVALRSCEQLKDHDDAYSEARALLGDWLNRKLRLELEVDDDEGDDVMSSSEERSPAPVNHDNFNDLYNCLAEEEEHSTVSSFLQGLMEQEVLDTGAMEELTLDVGQMRRKLRDPGLTMEARHRQVRENRARREAERQQQHRERDVRREARDEARRRERQEEARRRLEARRQEEMVQQEVVRLRRQMEERRALEQLVRRRERERAEGQGSFRSLQSAPTLSSKQQQHNAERLCQEQKIQTVIHMNNMKRLQRHFSAWYSAVLDRRLRMGKATALCDWKRQLRAWRAWRTAVWAEQRQREVARTEDELRTNNRRCHLAVESDRRRLLRRCLNEWQLWCRTEREQRELLVRQQETRRKMAALIDAAATGKLTATETQSYQPGTAAPEATHEAAGAVGKGGDHMSVPPVSGSSAAQQDEAPAVPSSRLNQPWQVTRRHVAPTAAELRDARRRGEGGGSLTRSPGSRFENRHFVQQQIITQQRKLLKEQQEQITRLREEKSMMGLELEMEKTAQVSQLSMRTASKPKSHDCDQTEQRAARASVEPDSRQAAARKAVARQTCPHPIITAMEARAHQRAERRKEVEELKRKKEEEKLAELKAAEEQRQREEEEEKRRAAEKRKEEKHLEREREEEKQRQLRRQQELLKLSRQHYNKTSLLRRGLAPWKRLMQLRQANTQLADSHHRLLLLRRCTLAWQRSARQSLSERETSAELLQQHFLLRRSLSCWKRLKDWRMIQEQRAERFYRARTLRRFLLALLDHVTQERLVDWDRQELAQQHNNRRVLSRCFLAWRRLPRLQHEEREKEERRRRLGRRVTEVLPNFTVKPLGEDDV